MADASLRKLLDKPNMTEKEIGDLLKKNRQKIEEIKKEKKKVDGRIDLPAPTPPDMRVRVRRFLAVPKDLSSTLSLPRWLAARLHRSASTPACVQLWSYCLPSSALPGL